MRHAMLIMAHHNFGQLEKLCKIFDDSRFEVFLHVDRNVWKCSGVERGFDKDVFLNANPNVHLIPPISIEWGAYSMIACEMRLLDEAVRTDKFDRYHLISGDDLPIKTLNEIDSYFMDKTGIEYVSIKEMGTPKEVSKEVRERVDLYWPLQARMGRRRTVGSRLCTVVQRVFQVSRLSDADCVYLAKGPNWFSITDELARFVIEKRPWVEEHYKNTRCADEMFIQTIVVNSRFRKALAPVLDDDNLAALRLIDWERGSPYTWSMADYSELMASDALFARKFDMEKHPDLYAAICRHVLN